MKRSYLTGRRVKSGPTKDSDGWSQFPFHRMSANPHSHDIGKGRNTPKVGFVIILFHPFFAVFFPVLTTLNISSSLIPLTFGSGTLNFAAFSFRLFLIAELSAFAFVPFSRSSRYCGRGCDDGSEGAEDFTFFSSCCLIALRIWIFWAWRVFCCSLARRPRRFWAEVEAAWGARARRLRVRSSWSSLSGRDY